MTDTIIAIENMYKSFKKAPGQDLLVLDAINFNLKEGELVALLGKSGSGKSTLLRIIAGLIAPTQGKVVYRGKPVTRPEPGISMVFQSFALMPWLHNIEEAVMLADRIIIFGSDPGHIREELQVTLPQPRDQQAPEFLNLVDNIYTLMTTGPKVKAGRMHREPLINLGYRLPDVDPSELSGMIETMIVFEERMDLPELADELMMNIDDLFPILETLEILGFAKVSDGDIHLTALGKAFSEANLHGRKQLFAKSLMEKVPLARYICRILDEKVGHRVSDERFLSKLEDYLSEKEAERVLRTMIDWGRYAELFAYDFNTRMLSLENPGISDERD